MNPALPKEIGKGWVSPALPKNKLLKKEWWGKLLSSAKGRAG